MLEGSSDLSRSARFQSYIINKCAGYCRGKGAALNVISPSLDCRCTSLVPPDEARLPDAACADPESKGDAVLMFYNHMNVDESACRLANVPMQKESFIFHYNDYRATFENGVVTTKMVSLV